jgi:hypothetical protein
MVSDRGVIDDLTDYIKKNLKKGYTKDSLKWALVNQGYPKYEVEKAIRRVDEEMARAAPILKTKPKITYQVVDSQPPKKSFWKKFFG